MLPVKPAAAILLLLQTLLDDYTAAKDYVKVG
jgi:hypothetical protein